MRSIVVVLWILVMIPRSAVGTQAPRVLPGAHIRFDARSVGSQLTGNLVGWESDTLWVHADDDAPGLTLMVPADSLSRLDVQRERRMTLEGLGMGALAGTLLAVAASPDWVDEDGNCTIGCLAYDVSPHLDTRIAVLGGLGALLGAILGAETKAKSWIAVPLQQGGVALGVQISF